EDYSRVFVVTIGSVGSAADGYLRQFFQRRVRVYPSRDNVPAVGRSYAELRLKLVGKRLFRYDVCRKGVYYGGVLVYIVLGGIEYFKLNAAALFPAAEEYVPDMPQTVPYRPQVRPAASAVGT
ncbi:MAG: hypothetical protein KIG62_09745, partial [Oscillospiraceae bacterium]|nr:hypothetical protein [Oscillospiraceae bacterium]